MFLFQGIANNLTRDQCNIAKNVELMGKNKRYFLNQRPKHTLNNYNTAITTQ